MAKAERVGEADGLHRTLTAADWKARISAALDPIDRYGDDQPWGSDNDLNPAIPAPLDGLQSAAVLIPIIERPEGPTVLFTERAALLRRHAGQISFPGGRCDAGETPQIAALREAREEVELDSALVTVAGLSTPYRTLTGYHITPVVGFVRPEAMFTASPAEVAGLFEAPLAFLMDTANFERRYRDQGPGPPRWHWAITWPAAGQDKVIWGATASIIRALHDRLERRDVGA